VATSSFQGGYGASWLDLPATLFGRRKPTTRDFLRTPADLGRWLAWQRLSPTARPDAADLRAAVELREALFAAAQAAVDGRRLPSAAVRTINRAAAASDAPELRGCHDPAVSRPPTTTAALGRMARQAIDALAGPDRARLRQCSGDSCTGIYLDLTGRRRWCSDTRCGNVARVRAHRARATRS